MPWQQPSLADLRRQNRDNIAGKLPGADAAVPNSVLRVLSDGNAGLAKGEHDYIADLADEILPDTADVFLPRHANIWLGGGKAATFASGSANATGTAGTIIPLATRLAAGNGIEYETTSAVTLGAGPTLVPAVALTSGSASNQEPGARLTISSAMSGVDAGMVVVDMSGGTDAESPDRLRERILLRIRQPPMGGAAHDYVAWALAQPGVTRAWCAPNEMGIGTVTVRFMMDELRASGGGFPLSGDVATVRAALDELRPVAVRDFFVSAPLAEPVSFTITNLVPDTTATRAAIAASVGAMVRERAAPASSTGGLLVSAQTIFREWVSAAILDADGVFSFDLTMADHAMPDNGHMATLGTITYA